MYLTRSDAELFRNWCFLAYTAGFWFYVLHSPHTWVAAALLLIGTTVLCLLFLFVLMMADAVGNSVSSSLNRVGGRKK